MGCLGAAGFGLGAGKEQDALTVVMPPSALPSPQSEIWSSLWMGLNGDPQWAEIQSRTPNLHTGFSAGSRSQTRVGTHLETWEVPCFALRSLGRASRVTRMAEDR